MPTSHYEFNQKIIEWQKQQCDVLLARGKGSSIVLGDMYHLQDIFGEHFHYIELESTSRFSIVYDTEKRILLVKLADDKILRTYQGL
jgi:hypothetical protein